MFTTFQELRCDPYVMQSLSELLMLKADVICVGKGLKSNLEHSNATDPSVEVRIHP
jgi:hypothetical protein